MGYGDKKVVVEVIERADKALEYAGSDGKTQSFYPGRQIWLDFQDLQVWQFLKEGEGDESQPSLTTQVRGYARLEDYDISIIGEPTNKVRTLKVSIEARDSQASIAEAEGEFFLSLSKPMGAAHLGFSRADWEIGNHDEWWLSCHVAASCFAALRDGVTSKTLQGVKLGLRLKDLYTTEHPMAPISGKAHLFLRPNRADNTIDWPETATGYVMHLSMSLAMVDMRPVEVKEETGEHEPLETRRVESDPVAVAIGVLATSVAGLRTTVKWVGGIVALCLLMIVFK